MKNKLNLLVLCLALVCSTFMLGGCFEKKGYIPFKSSEVTIVKISQIEDNRPINTKVIEDKTVWAPFFEEINNSEFGNTLLNPGLTFAGCKFAFTINSGDKYIIVAITVADAYKKTYTARVFKNSTRSYSSLGVTPFLTTIVDCYETL